MSFIEYILNVAFYISFVKSNIKINENKKNTIKGEKVYEKIV